MPEVPGYGVLAACDMRIVCFITPTCSITTALAIGFALSDVGVLEIAVTCAFVTH